MKFKLDENIGQLGKAILVEAGHEVCTIPEQNLQSAPDPTVIAVCQAEQRCLVTLALDFSNPLQFDPSQYFGIAVLRLPKCPKPQDLLNAIMTLSNALKTEDITGKLWTVQAGRIRIYQQENQR
jgi:predicted nuclease of predicted toxin-antitoxin system